MDIETIYRLYFRDVCLFLQGLTRSEALAEELTQETFFRALDGLEDYDGKQDVRAWLFTVARNAYYDHCRRAKRTAPLEAAADAAKQRGSRADMLAEVAAGGPAMLTTEDTAAANAWLRRRVRVFVRDNQVSEVRFAFW